MQSDMREDRNSTKNLYWFTYTQFGTKIILTLFRGAVSASLHCWSIAHLGYLAFCLLRSDFSYHRNTTGREKERDDGANISEWISRGGIAARHVMRWLRRCIPDSDRTWPAPPAVQWSGNLWKALRTPKLYWNPSGIRPFSRPFSEVNRRICGPASDPLGGNGDSLLVGPKSSVELY